MIIFTIKYTCKFYPALLRVSECKEVRRQMTNIEELILRYKEKKKVSNKKRKGTEKTETTND